MLAGSANGPNIYVNGYGLSPEKIISEMMRNNFQEPIKKKNRNYFLGSSACVDDDDSDEIIQNLITY